MKKTSRTKRSPTAESIARLADKGKDVSAFFTNSGKMMPQLGGVELDLNQEMINELTETARRLKVTRKALT